MATQLIDLTGRVAVVTGSARGSGEAAVWLVKTSYAAVTLANGPSAG